MAYRVKNVRRVNDDYVQATCATCDWKGQNVPIRTVEGWDIAERDRDEHARTHAEASCDA